MKRTTTEYTGDRRTPTVLPEMKELLPSLSGEQFSSLEADILKNGCYAPSSSAGGDRKSEDAKSGLVNSPNPISTPVNTRIFLFAGEPWQANCAASITGAARFYEFAKPYMEHSVGSVETIERL